MMPTDTVFESLWLATWTSSLAILVVLLLRSPVRRRFGAGIAYALWWLPLATWLALWLPARVVEIPVQAGTPTIAPTMVSMTLANPTQTFDIDMLWLPMWLLGAGVMLAMLCWQQRRFEQALGQMHALDGERGTWQAQGAEGLPAVVGLLRPRIILPADIDTRFDDEQRRLMLAHERIHLRRGDAWANAFVALARCVFWFNPLAYIAASRMRHDQELACDARVIAAHPHARRAYGEAMLKNSTSSLMAPLGCHWGITHPMKDRVMLLKNAIPSRGTRLTGALLVGVVTIVVAAAAWAALPPRQVQRSQEVIVRSEGRDFQANLGIAVDGGASNDIMVLGSFGEPFTVRIEDSETGLLELKGTVTQTAANAGSAYRIETQLHRDGKSIGNPVMVVEADKAARIKLGKQASSGEFSGADINVRIGDVDTAALQAHHQTEMARHQVERTMVVADQAHRAAVADAQDAAAQARVAAAGAQKAAEEAAGMSATEARVAAEAARVAASEAAAAAAEAAVMADEAAKEASQKRIERRVIRKSAPPAPPRPPVPPTPNAPAPPLAPLAPPAPPAVMSGNASIHIEREVRNGTAPVAPARAININTLTEAVAAGGRALTPAEVARAGLNSGYRWVDIQPLMADKDAMSMSMGIQADIFSVPEDGEGPHHAGYKP